MKPIKLKSLLQESSRDRKRILLKRADASIINLKNALQKDFQNDPIEK